MHKNRNSRNKILCNLIEKQKNEKKKKNFGKPLIIKTINN